MKRILDCGGSDFREMHSTELAEAIRLSEGRTLLCEVLWPATPLIDGVTNAAVAVAFGADLILLNMFSGEDLFEYKSRLGRPVGVNVEPSEEVPEHRQASRANLERLTGADFVVITANPDAQVDTDGIVSAAELARELMPDTLIFAGKMHGSGGQGMIEERNLRRLADVSDAVLLPAPGTVPGSREELVAELAATAHAAQSLVVATVGTSQEGADPDTIRALSLAAKRTGADVLHLGDGGISGIAEPTNILNASLTIRGRRHTYRRMAMR